MNRTEIFEDYESFYAREDKLVNGVSPDFAEEHPSWEEDNVTNEGCWNCFRCQDCRSCKYCSDCRSCEFEVGVADFPRVWKLIAWVGFACVTLVYVFFKVRCP